jgi:hypothetical protein
LSGEIRKGHSRVIRPYRHCGYLASAVRCAGVSPHLQIARLANGVRHYGSSPGSDRDPTHREARAGKEGRHGFWRTARTVLLQLIRQTSGRHDQIADLAPILSKRLGLPQRLGSRNSLRRRHCYPDHWPRLFDERRAISMSRRRRYPMMVFPCTRNTAGYTSHI